MGLFFLRVFLSGVRAMTGDVGEDREWVRSWSAPDDDKKLILGGNIKRLIGRGDEA